MSAVPLDVADYLTSDTVIGRADGVALALPMLHHETLDQASGSWCRDWRAEIRMTDLNAGPSAPRVTVGAVDFIMVQPSEDAPNRPIAEHLSMLGPRAARFGELFVGGRLEPRSRRQPRCRSASTTKVIVGRRRVNAPSRPIVH